MIKIQRMSEEAEVNLGGLDVPALTADSSGDIVYANEAAIDLLGLDWQRLAASLVDQAVVTGCVDEAHHCMLKLDGPAGVHRHFAVHVSKDSNGSIVLFIDEEVSADLIPSAKLEEILESISDCFFALDGHGTFVYANAHAAEFLGVPKRELLGRTLESFHPAETRFELARQKAMIERETTTYDSRLPSEERWIEVRAYPAGDGMVVYFSDITDRVHVQERLQFLALHDSLTKLPNRSYFQEQLKRAVAKSNRGVPSALLFLDMDRFKAVNDTVGHAAGDEVLVEFTKVVLSCVREEDTFARFGGDEFALLLENTSLDDALAISERIQKAVREHGFVIGGHVFSLGASIGLTPVRGTGAGGHVMALADSAMYEAKRRGGEQCVVVMDG
ncbi:MAG: diguanylate cyclase [Coriobacteriales bacterium]|nr:diguanylate cyclase [Coriobacteriales bacterium]